MVDSTDRGRYLATGWRIVGREADAIAERAALDSEEQLKPGNAADTLYAVQFTLPAAVDGRSTVDTLLDLLSEEQQRHRQDLQRLSRDLPARIPPSRLEGLNYTVRDEPGQQWLGELLSRSVHPVVAGAPITTRVVIEGRRSYTRVSVRVTADEGVASVRGYVGAGQAQPGFIRSLRREGLTPTWHGGPLHAKAIQNGDVPDLVRSILASSERDMPVVILSPLEQGGYLIDPNDFLWELLGRGKLYYLTNHRQTFELTDTVGDRRMSCFWGAARAYMPEWSRYDDPFDHPLIVGDRITDPVMRAAWLGELGTWLGSRLVLPPSLDSPTPPPTCAPAPALADAPTRSMKVAENRTSRVGHQLETSSTPADGTLRVEANEDPAHAASTVSIRNAESVATLLEGLVGVVQGLVSSVDQLRDEIDRLRTIGAVRSSSTAAIERRLGRLEDILNEAFPDGSAGPRRDRVGLVHTEEDQIDAEDDASSLVEVVQDVAASHSDALLMLDSTVDSARESPYEDPERVRAILEAMARVARRRRDGQLSTSLREAFADLGIDYRSAISQSTSARMREQYRFQYEGEMIEAVEHIVLGKTYDPRRCLRIYFSSRVVSDPRFIVAHVGRHFTVRSTT